MNLRSVAVLACQILAIVTSIRAVETGSYALNYLSSAMRNSIFPNGATMSPPPFSISIFILQFSPLALLLMFALFLWTQADFISAKMVGEQDKSMVPVSVSTDVQKVAFSVLGAYVLVSALPKLLQLLLDVWFMDSQTPKTSQYWSALAASDLSFAFVQVVLGLYLLFGARGLITLLANLRNIRRDTPLRQEIDTE